MAVATLVFAGVARGQRSSGGSIVGIVTARETGAPLPYADVLVEGARSGVFVDSRGQFRASGLPAGDVRIRVRRLGFTPATIVAKVHAGATDTVRVALSQVAMQLDRVSVHDKICPGGPPSSDTAVVAILQQVQLNAERAAMLAHQMPFETDVERIIDKVVDTISLPSEHEWQYAPGNLVEVPGEQRGVGEARMYVVQLTDFASARFVAAHCFRFAGLDGQKLIQVDVEPTRDVKTPDVRGSLFLDPVSYQMVRSSLFMQMPSPVNPLETWETRVDTWFREILPALPVIDRVCKRMTVITEQRRNAGRSVESQRLIDLRFLNATPPGVIPIDTTTRPVCSR